MSTSLAVVGTGVKVKETEALIVNKRPASIEFPTGLPSAVVIVSPVDIGLGVGSLIGVGGTLSGAGLVSGTTLGTGVGAGDGVGVAYFIPPKRAARMIAIT